MATDQMLLLAVLGVGVGTYGGHVVWPVACALGAGVIVGAQIGTRLSQRMKAAGITRLLTVAMMYPAVRLHWFAR